MAMGLLTVTGLLTTMGLLTVTGFATGTGFVTVTSFVIGTDLLIVTGLVTGTGLLTVTGLAIGTDLVTGIGLLTGMGLVTGTALVTGTGLLIVTGLVTGTGRLTVTGLETGTGRLTVTGLLMPMGLLIVTGLLTPMGLLTPTGRLTVTGRLTGPGLGAGRGRSIWFQIRCFSSWVLEVNAASQKGQGKVSLSEMAPWVERADMDTPKPTARVGWAPGFPFPRLPLPQAAVPYPLAPLVVVLKPVDAGEFQPAPGIWTLYSRVRLELVFPLVHQGELGVGKARLLTLQPPRPLPASPRLSTVPRPAGLPHVVHWAPSRSPQARSSRQMWAGGSVLDPEQASPARQWASRNTSQEPTQPSGSSRECLGVPDSRLLDAPFSSLPSCRQLDFPGQSRVRPGWAPSAQPGPLAALQHTTHQGSENAFTAASSTSQGGWSCLE